MHVRMILAIYVATGVAHKVMYMHVGRLWETVTNRAPSGPAPVHLTDHDFSDLNPLQYCMDVYVTAIRVV